MFGDIQRPTKFVDVLNANQKSKWLKKSLTSNGVRLKSSFNRLFFAFFLSYFVTPVTEFVIFTNPPRTSTRCPTSFTYVIHVLIV